MKASMLFLSVLLVADIVCSECKSSDECVTFKDLEDMHDRTIKTVEKMLESRPERAINGEGVAFTSVLTGGYLGHIGIHQPIIFNSVQLNEGNGYNKFTGVFTAPTNGVYLFSYFLAHLHVGQVWLELMHNGKKVNAAVTDGFTQNENDQGGNVAVLRLEAGDTVWVQSWHQNDATLDGASDFSTFSGVMIYN